MGLHSREGRSGVLDGLSADEIARFDALESRIAVNFRRLRLLREAMTHASWNNERGQPSGPGHDNERLEYLGDAVLELIVGEYLFRRFPGYDEGQLTQLRAALVNTVSLARLAERLELGDTLLLGRGAAKTGARKLPSLLANSFEAMIGAVFLDQGYRVATRIFLQNIGDLADWTDENHKGRLQGVAQERTGSTPTYRVVAIGGPGHKREYSAEARVGGEVAGEGKGGTKQAAEQAAAHAALEYLDGPGRKSTAPPTAASRGRSRNAGTDLARVRRRVAEVAGERTAASRGRGGTAPEPAPERPDGKQRRGLIGKLRKAAEVLVGRGPDATPTAPGSEGTVVAPSGGVTSDGTRRRGRRGGRGGRGRGRQSAP